MKKINIGLIISAILLVLCLGFTVINCISTLFTIYVGKIGDLKTEHVYIQNGRDCIVISTLYGFKNIAVDGYGVIYIGRDKGISVYNKEHELLGEFAYEFSNFAFKIDNNFELSIISSDSRLIKGEPQKDNTTYLVKYYVAMIEGTKNMQADIIESKVIAQNYHEYKSENGFSESNIYKTKDAEYKYRPYGILKTVDKTDGKTEYSKLPAFVLPLPSYMIIILDSVSFALLVLFIILKVRSHINRKKLSTIQ